MEDTLNIPLTTELRAAIDRLTEAEGLSPEGLAQPRVCLCPSVQVPTGAAFAKDAG